MGLRRCEAAGLYLARVRAKERGNIFHCVIPLSRLPPPRSGKKRISMDATARRGDGIAAKFLRSLRNPFSLHLCSALTAHRKRGGGPPPPPTPGTLLSPRDTTGGLAFRGLGRVLRSPGLNLSRAFVDPLAC